MSTVALFLVRVSPTKAYNEPLAFLAYHKNSWFRKMGFVMYRKGHFLASTSQFHTFSAEQFRAVGVRLHLAKLNIDTKKRCLVEEQVNFF